MAINNIMAVKKTLFSLAFVLIISFTFVSAEKFGYNLLEDGENLNPALNYSTLNVNNSQFFDGYSVASLKTYFQSLYDSVYCKLTGCTMTGNINMGGNSITNVSNVLNYELTTEGTNVTLKWLR